MVRDKEVKRDYGEIILVNTLKRKRRRRRRKRRRRMKKMKILQNKRGVKKRGRRDS